jgi:hypothetical protein
VITSGFNWAESDAAATSPLFTEFDSAKVISSGASLRGKGYALQGQFTQE